MDAPGKGMLKVVSILFIIFGAIATIVSIIALAGSAWLTAVTGGFAGILVVATVIMLVVSVADLVIGIIGLKKCADPAQYGYFIVTGIILCVLSLVSWIMSMQNQFDFTGFIGFVLPILYIVGGFMNKKAVTAS